MENQLFTKSQRDIFGDEIPTQKIARDVLPILVSRAQNDSTIIMLELAEEIVPDLTSFNWTLGWSFAWIQHTLYKLERQDDWNYGKIPNITAIVLAEPEKPTNWADEHTNLSWEEYETSHIQPVFKYPHWDKVMEYVISRLREVGLWTDVEGNALWTDAEGNALWTDAKGNALWTM